MVIMITIIIIIIIIIIRIIINLINNAAQKGFSGIKYNNKSEILKKG